MQLRSVSVENLGNIQKQMLNAALEDSSELFVYVPHNDAIFIKRHYCLGQIAKLNQDLKHLREMVLREDDAAEKYNQVRSEREEEERPTRSDFHETARIISQIKASDVYLQEISLCRSSDLTSNATNTDNSTDENKLFVTARYE